MVIGILKEEPILSQIIGSIAILLGGYVSQNKGVSSSL